MRPPFPLALTIILAATHSYGGQSRDLLQGGVRLAISTPATTAYVHQRVPVEVVLTGDGFRVRDVGYPSFPQSLHFRRSGEAEITTKETEGKETTTIVFRGTVVVSRTGEVPLAPVTLEAGVDIPAEEGREAFFGATETVRHVVSANGPVLTVREPPPGGKPSSYTGAVGSFTVSLRGGKNGTEGVPFAVQTIVTGDGFLPRACPRVVTEEGTPLESAPVDSSERTLHCDHILIPDEAGQVRLKTGFSFFDPTAGRYRTASDTFTAIISHGARRPTPATQPPAPTPAASSQVSRAVPASATAGGVLTTLLAAFLIRRKRNHKKDSDEPASPLGTETFDQHVAAASEAAAREDAETFFRHVSRALQEAIADVTGVPSAGATVGDLYMFPPHGTNDEFITMLADLTATVEKARFSGSIVDTNMMPSLLARLEEMRPPSSGKENERSRPATAR